MTTSTSEAYSFLFRLLCDPADEVLVAQPSYPLFDFLADLDDVRLTGYPLFYDFGWWIDFAALEQRITSATRAILLVHPNNPTGHATSSAERRRLQELCARRGLALIVDEVFLDYGLTGEGLTGKGLAGKVGKFRRRTPSLPYLRGQWNQQDMRFAADESRLADSLRPGTRA